MQSKGARNRGFYFIAYVSVKGGKCIEDGIARKIKHVKKVLAREGATQK